MQAGQFYQLRQADWQSLTELLDRGQHNLRRLSPEDVHALGRLYRAAASDLALAQRDFPDQRVTAYLNQLVARAHSLVYRSEPWAVGRLLRFFTHDFPRAYRNLFPFILAASLLLIIPALAAGIGAAVEPAAARWLLPEAIQPVIRDLEQQELWTDIPVHERPFASSFIMQNNLRVAFLAFSSGVLCGVFTVWVLILNGLMLGGVTGLAAHYGVAFELWTFVIGHGVIELSVIAMAGGAGLRLGWAVLQPGLHRRRDALAEAARRAVRLVGGGVPLLVVAGLIEGFVSPAEGLPWPVKWGMGLGTGALLYGYLLLAGRTPNPGDERFSL